MKNRLLIAVVTSGVMGMVGSASAQAVPEPPPPPPPPSNTAAGDVAAVAVQDDGRQKHDGFFLRMNIGPSVLASFGEDDSTIVGFGPALNLSIGGAPVDNFVIHGDLYFSSAVDPNVEQGDSSYDAQGLLNNAGLGVGVTYYIMPINFFLTAGLSYNTLHFDADEGEDGDVGHGAGTRFMFGKEWWVGDNWGLGIAGQVAYNLTMANDAEAHSISTAVLFSATYQ